MFSASTEILCVYQRQVKVNMGTPCSWSLTAKTTESAIRGVSHFGWGKENWKLYSKIVRDTNSVKCQYVVHLVKPNSRPHQLSASENPLLFRMLSGKARVPLHALSYARSGRSHLLE
jgi:hypothetical protein